MSKRKLIYITVFIMLSILIFLIIRNKSDLIIENLKTDKLITVETIPETINWTNYKLDREGISFTYPSFWKVVKNDNSLEVGAISIKIEKLACANPKPSKEFTNPIKIYGYQTQINEPNQTAYICNNKNTACLDIFSNNEKMTESFFHGFISTLHINKEFDEIQCDSGRNF